jgi:hypothetical protein
MQHPVVPDILDLAHVFGERFRDFDLDWRQIGVVIPGAEVRSILGMLEGGNRVNEVCRYGGLETTMDLTGKGRGSFVWLKYGMPVSWTGPSCPGAQIDFKVLLGSSDEDGIPVGSWDTASSCGALLDLDLDQDCAGWQSGAACRLEASLFSVDGVFSVGDCGLSSNVRRFSIFVTNLLTGPYQAHPHDIATATRFSVPICTAGETAGFSVVIHGLAHGVWYGLALVVLNGSDYMHGTESLLEVLDESADVDARESYSRRLSLALPGLPAGEYTIRLSVFDLFQIWIQDFDQGLKHRSMGTLGAGSWKEEWLVSTTVQNLHVRKNEVLILKSQLHSGLI